MSSFKKFILPLILFLCVLVVYIHNLSRATYGGDVGDLLAAASVMGVAHPPGYPLFTLLGFLLSRINLITPAFMIGLISAVSGALGVLLFYLFSYRLTKSKLISLLCALILAFTYYYWFYSEIAEAFSLNNLFVIALISFALAYYQSKKRTYLFLLAFLAGLSLTNHQTIVLIFPSLALLAVKNWWSDKQKLKVLLECIGCFALGLLPYGYVPIAAMHNPAVNWDHVHDLSSFLHLVLRQDYGTLSIGSVGAASFAQKLVTLNLYFSAVIIQATLPAVVIIILGMIYSFKKQKQIFYSLILAFLISGPAFFLYAGFSFTNAFMLGVYERFVLLSFVILLMFLPFGFMFINNLLQKFFSKKEFALLILAVFFIIPLLLFKFNYAKTNLSNLTLGESVIYDILSPLPKNSVIFLDGDTIIFNTWYLQDAKNYRPDINVINANGSALDNKLYLAAANTYYREHPKEKKSQNVSVNVLARIAETRNVYSSVDMLPVKNSPFSWIPSGLSYQLVFNNDLPSEKEYIQQTESLWNKLKVPLGVRSFAEGNLTISDIYAYYSDSLLHTGKYFADIYKDNNQALKYYQKAMEVDPQNYNPYQFLGSYYLANGNCSLAELNFKQVLSLAPYQNLIYYLLYYDYQSCFKSQAKANQVVSDYRKNLNSDFFKDLNKIQNSQMLKNKK
jgi:hypothetical protein